MNRVSFLAAKQTIRVGSCKYGSAWVAMIAVMAGSKGR